MLHLGKSGEAHNDGYFSFMLPLSSSVIFLMHKILTICDAICKPAMQMLLRAERSQW
jgi:hypothetical protein